MLTVFERSLILFSTQSRLDDRTGLRAMLRSDVMFESAGVHNFIVFIA